MDGHENLPAASEHIGPAGRIRDSIKRPTARKLAEQLPYWYKHFTDDRTLSQYNNAGLNDTAPA